MFFYYEDDSNPEQPVEENPSQPPNPYSSLFLETFESASWTGYTRADWTATDVDAFLSTYEFNGLSDGVVNISSSFADIEFSETDNVYAEVYDETNELLAGFQKSTSFDSQFLETFESTSWTGYTRADWTDVDVNNFNTMFDGRWDGVVNVSSSFAEIEFSQSDSIYTEVYDETNELLADFQKSTSFESQFLETFESSSWTGYTRADWTDVDPATFPFTIEGQWDGVVNISSSFTEVEFSQTENVYTEIYDETLEWFSGFQKSTNFDSQFLEDFESNWGGIYSYPSDAIVVTSSLFAYLDPQSLDGSNSTTWPDYYGNSAIATLENDATYVNDSVYVTKSGDVVDFEPNSEFNFGTGDFSVETWFYSIGGITYGRIWMFDAIGNNSVNLQLFIHSTSLSIHTNTYLTTYSLPNANNVWHHAVVTRENGTMKLYVDNVLVKEFSNSTNINLNSGKPRFRVGGYYDAYRSNLSGQFRGYLGTFRIYGKALSEQEIQQNYNAETARFS